MTASCLVERLISKRYVYSHKTDVERKQALQKLITESVEV